MCEGIAASLVIFNLSLQSKRFRATIIPCSVMNAKNGDVGSSPVVLALTAPHLACRAAQGIATLSGWVDEIPPAQHSMRYGNPAYRDWFQRLAQEAPGLVSSMLPDHLKARGRRPYCSLCTAGRSS